MRTKCCFNSVINQKVNNSRRVKAADSSYTEKK